MGIIKDQSETRKVENSLLESEAKFRGIVEEALVGAYILKQLGCKIIQGYLFSKPVSANEFEELLKIGTIDISNDLKLENRTFVEKR
ncbi:hypothetical protein CSV79_10420 [Sporosarcina sp. P13]|uniref:hypothetical protein n=1 Tax=Sporosarcina sp. P13 TaxID=2048263 RepID=UPI000C17315A|nr:hypothetical protein [Sporosarcina sp. P13]PIC63744.1 hypothetical protein CSV79_10420 [Sporosarcina sp. P13]